jgi:hypothetical protein
MRARSCAAAARGSRAEGIARRKAATVSFLRSASTARISTPPPASGTVTSVTKSRCPRLSAISSMPITPNHSQAVQSTARSIQRSRMPSIVSSETPSLRAASATVELINMRQAHCSYAFVLGLRGAYHSHRCVVVGLPAQYGHRYRLGRISTKTATSNKGRWRRRTTASSPCRSRMSRPQRWHRVPSALLSTRMDQCACSVRCVERTRTSGKFSGT